MKTAWTITRLERLYARYNRQFWRGRLRNTPVRIAPMDGNLGLYQENPGKITVDIRKHKSDRQVRSTLLHEMAHAAADERNGEVHGSKFWSQIERLLRQNAPITVGFSETQDLRILRNVVPQCFPLARRAMNTAHRRHQQELEKEAREPRESGITDQYVTDEDIVGEFKNAAYDGLPWRAALRAVGREYGLIDVDGAPVNQRAKGIFARGRMAHRRARAQVLTR
jgi:hypothetical protein